MALGQAYENDLDNVEVGLGDLALSSIGMKKSGCSKPSSVIFPSFAGWVIANSVVLLVCGQRYQAETEQRVKLPRWPQMLERCPVVPGSTASGGKPGAGASPQFLKLASTSKLSPTGS